MLYCVSLNDLYGVVDDPYQKLTCLIAEIDMIF